MAEHNAQVDIVMVYHRSIRHGGETYTSPEIRIVDALSRQMLCIIYLDSEQVLGLLTSLHQTVDAWVCPDGYRGRIGRQMIVEQRDVPIEVLATGEGPARNPERWAAAQQWADGERTNVGPDTPIWDEASLQFNAGWKLVLRRWERVNSPDESVITKEQLDK